LQVCGEDADADHVAELAARRSQDGTQVGEELLGFGLRGVGKPPGRRIGAEECGHEYPSIHLDCLWHRAWCAGDSGVSIVRMHHAYMAPQVVGAFSGEWKFSPAASAAASDERR
jgi:hypothetical protein